MNDMYEFIVKGDLDMHWSQWFDGLAVTHASEDKTLIRGLIRDQAELYGIINKFRDLGLSLISLRRLDPEK